MKFGHLRLGEGSSTNKSSRVREKSKTLPNHITCWKSILSGGKLEHSVLKAISENRKGLISVKEA